MNGRDLEVKMPWSTTWPFMPASATEGLGAGQTFNGRSRRRLRKLNMGFIRRNKHHYNVQLECSQPLVQSAALVFLLPHSCDKQDCSGLINSFWMAASRQRLVGTSGVWSAVPVTNLSLPDFNDARHSCGPDAPNKNRLINHTNAVKAVGFVFIWDQFSCNVELAIRRVMFAAAADPVWSLMTDSGSSTRYMNTYLSSGIWKLKNFYWTFQLNPFVNFKLLENELGAMEDMCHERKSGCHNHNYFKLY